MSQSDRQTLLSAISMLIKAYEAKDSDLKVSVVLEVEKANEHITTYLYGTNGFDPVTHLNISDK